MESTPALQAESKESLIMDGQAQLQRHGCGLSGNQEGQVGTQRHLAQGHTGKTFTYPSTPSSWVRVQESLWLHTQAGRVSRNKLLVGPKASPQMT